MFIMQGLYLFWPSSYSSKYLWNKNLSLLNLAKTYACCGRLLSRVSFLASVLCLQTITVCLNKIVVR